MVVPLRWDLTDATHLLGDGYEPHVDELNGRLIYSIPVDSSFVGFMFQFEITPADLAVLRTDRYRRATFYLVLHTMLQNSTIRGNPEVSDDDFRRLADRLLFGTADDVRARIDAVDRAHNTGLDHDIAEAMRHGSD